MEVIERLLQNPTGNVLMEVVNPRVLQQAAETFRGMTEMEEVHPGKNEDMNPGKKRNHAENNSTIPTSQRHTCCLFFQLK
jgi:hypothetical protein